MAVKTQFDFLKNRRTRIIATLGPASSSLASITALIEAGVNIFRLNMSHGDHAGHTEVFQRVCTAREALGVEVAVLADLCGPKIRTGSFSGGSMALTEGEEVTVTVTPGEGGDGVIVSQYESLVDDVEAGDRILLADGLFELQVISKEGADARCLVVHGGTITDKKGINLPGVNVSAPSMTEKDHADARFALDLGVDFIALSFVRTATDINELHDVVDAHEHDVQVVAKIEKPEALDNAEDILAVTDAIMVARGDLGVELPAEQVPGAQAQLISLAEAKGKPVIVATQMLESMMTNSRPTRAEVTDISHAVSAGTDAVMLSGETAAGDFPLESVQMMDRIARQTEVEIWSRGAYGLGKVRSEPPIPLWNVIAETTSRMSRDLMARAVVVVTRSGKSAQIVSTARPAAPIIALTADHAVCRKLALNWGVVPIVEPRVGNANPNELARELAMSLGLGEEGQYVLLVRGFHGDQVLNLPSVTVIEI